MSNGWAGLRPSGVKVGSQTDICDALPCHLEQHLDRLLHRPGAIVYRRKKMGMKVDHACGRVARSTEDANSSSPAGAS
jgi:hypothetical protein